MYIYNYILFNLNNIMYLFFVLIICYWIFVFFYDGYGIVYCICFGKYLLICFFLLFFRNMYIFLKV